MDAVPVTVAEIVDENKRCILTKGKETISRTAGSAHGSGGTVAELEGVGAAIGRPARQRTTTYGHVDRPNVVVG